MSSIITLYNPETQETFEISVSDSDAERARNDLEFATRLLEARSEESQDAGLVSPAWSSTESGTDDASSAGEASLGNGFKWSHEAILLLIDEYRREQKNLASGKISQKRVWVRIALVLEDKGHKATGPQCLSKFNGMKRTYKSIKDHNGRSGSNVRTWAYLDLMEGVLGEKPFMQPVTTLSSTGTGTALSRAKALSEETSPSSATPKRKPTSDIAEAIVKSRKIAEERKDRRHQERREDKKEFQEKMLLALGALTDKINL